MPDRPIDGQELKGGERYRHMRGWWNWLLRETRANRIVFGAGIVGQRLPSGTVISAKVGGRKIPAFVSVAVGVRSGPTPGTGKVLPATWDGTDFEADEDADEIDVLNPYESGGTIGVDVFVWIYQWSGDWWIDNGDCEAGA